MDCKIGLFFLILILLSIACSKSNNGNLHDGKEGAKPSWDELQISKQESKVTSGSSLKVTTKVIEPESLEPPGVVPVENLPRVVPDRSRVRLVKNPRMVKIPDTLPVITPGENGVPLPRTVRAIGKVVPAIHTPPVPALPLKKKDNAITEIRYLDIGQGMSATGVWCMMEDSRGNLWFGTIGRGVSRYDGSTFAHYTTKEGLSDNFPRSMLEDSHGNLWFGTWGGGVNRFDGETFTHFTMNEGLLSNEVMAIVEDSSGYIWFGSPFGGVSRYDGENFTHFTESEGLIHNSAKPLLIDRENNIWMGSERGICRYDPDASNGQGSFTHFTKKEGLHENFIWSMLEDSQGNIWMGGAGGVSRYDGQRFIHYTKNEGLGENFINGILEDNKGNIWFGIDGYGVIRFEPSLPNGIAGTLTHFSDQEGLSHKNVLSMLKDSRGKLWFGTWGGGVNRYDGANLNYYSIDNGLKDRDIRGILEDSRGNIWFGAWGSGLFHFNPEHISNGFSRITKKEGLRNNNMLSILEDSKGDFWFGTSIGLSFYDGENITNYTDGSGLNHGTIVSLYEDSQGNIWIGGMNKKLTRFDGQGFTHYDLDLGLGGGNCIYTILEDRHGNMWFGTWDGVVRYDPDEGPNNFIRYSSDDGLGSNFIMSSLEDSQGNLWFGTWGGGLSRFTPLHEGSVAGSFTHFTTEEGLNNNWVAGLLEDGQQRIWVNTLKGFTVLIPYSTEPLSINGTRTENYRFFTIDQESGLERTNLTWNSNVCLDSENRLWWGTTAGLSMMDLNQLELPQAAPQMKLNTIEIAQTFVDYRRLNNEEYQNSLPVGKALAGTFEGVANYENYPEKLGLPHSLNSLTFHFAAIDWSAPEKLKYSYLLEGLDQRWSPLSTDNKVEYRNLSHGRYTFKVKAIGAAQLWSEIFEYSFTIYPPWWKTWWAYVLYVSLVVSALYRLYLFQLNRKLASAETIRLKEMDAFKTRLYTNITHEFRTPLTVISGVVDQVRENPGEWFRKGLDMIKRNSRQLLNLVNQMLELSKLESNSLSVNLIQANIIAYLRYLAESLHSYAETKDINIHFHAGSEVLYMDYDPDKIQTIFFNLLGNAIKFTPDGGNVWVTVTNSQELAGADILRIEVKDNGVGIPEMQLPFIFDRFYQVDDSPTRKDEGTGIGLALTKELVKLLEGRIEVESQEGKGTKFMVWLPIRRSAPKKNQMLTTAHTLPFTGSDVKEMTSFLPGGQNEADDRPLALLIEDNKDVVNYLKACLQNTYQVEIATNGQQGIKKALEIGPDIVISDIMMPEKDGFEVCATLKRDERSSHIPIILLTAKADGVSRRTGLKYGADAYLVKPFDKEELEIRLQQLIELRQRLKEKYSRAELEKVDVKREKDPELLFLKKLETVILENISNEDFRVEPHLCQALSMSRPLLYKKLKALTNQSPSHFMRAIRLRKARKLLQTTRAPIGEIADQVGFREHSYFTKVYTDTFFETPSDTRNNEILS